MVEELSFVGGDTPWLNLMLLFMRRTAESTKYWVSNLNKASLPIIIACLRGENMPALLFFLTSGGEPVRNAGSQMLALDAQIGPSLKA